MTSEKLSELHAQAVWYDRAWRPSKLKTYRGDEVEVIYPGEWNRGSGPDFKDAVIRVGNKAPIRGDIELHLKPADWRAHNHASDPAYRNLIAHVTWFRGPRPKTLPKEAVSIALAEAMTNVVYPSEIDLSHCPWQPQPIAERPCHIAFADSDECARATLLEAGRTRMKEKSERFVALLSGMNRADVFYRETFAAFGYSKNTQAFREIAMAFSYETVVDEPFNMEFTLRMAGEFAQLNERGSRPNNAPLRRLEAAARFFNETDIMKLIDWTDFSRSGCREMMKIMRKGGFIGRGRAAAIIANVVIPFAIAEGRIDDSLEWLPAEDISHIVRLTARRLFGAQFGRHIWSGNGLLIQGLIRIYRECCLHYHPECKGCEVAELAISKFQAMRKSNEMSAK